MKGHVEGSDSATCERYGTERASEPAAMEPTRIVHRQMWRQSGFHSGDRSIPEETAVAVTYNGGTYAVMMATPQDLEDFAVGGAATGSAVKKTRAKRKA